MSLTVLKNFVLILDLVVAIALTVSIFLQSGKSGGLSGAIAGSSDSFMAKGGTKTKEAMLATATKILGFTFVLLSLVTTILVSAAAKIGQ